MEEPFGGTMTMDEWSHHPQVLRSKGNAFRGQGARSGGSDVTGGVASKQPDANRESGRVRAKRPVKETACGATTS